MNTSFDALEPLPEYVHQGIPTDRLWDAIASLRHAEEATSTRDKETFLRRADASIMYARRSAVSVMARWREYNERARALGAFIDKATGE